MHPFSSKYPLLGHNRQRQRALLSSLAVITFLALGCRGGELPAPSPEPAPQPEPAFPEGAPTPREAAAEQHIQPPPLDAQQHPASPAEASGDAPQADSEALRTLPAGAPEPTSQAIAPEQTDAGQRLVLVEQPTPLQVAFAEHLAGLAAARVEQDTEGTAIPEAATLLEAAVRLSPRDDRLARQLVMTRLLLGDIRTSLEALEHYRRLQPDDVLAQIRYVDLTAAEMEVVDTKLTYLLQVAQTNRVPSEVRSHAAVAASLLLREVMDEQGADAWLEEAVALDPYSPQALQLFYERRVATGATRAERVEALALLARSNVVQPAVLETLAEELSEAGLTEQANEIYLRTLQAYASLGMAPKLELLRDVAALQLVANRPDAASQTIEGGLALAAGTPGADAEAAALADLHMLDLLARQRTMPAPDQLAEAAEATRNTLRFMLSSLSAQMRDVPRPTTNPDGTIPRTELVDVAADATLLSAQNLDEKHQPLRVPYATLLADLAWVDLYFLGQPTEPRLVEALVTLVPEQSLALRRLHGWQLWRLGQEDAAREALLPISEEDRLARLALLLMQPPGLGIEESARELLRSEPTGLVGAFLFDSLSRFGVRVEPAEDAAEVQLAFAALPVELFSLLEPTAVRSFYSLTADPRLARYPYGEPILLNVSVRNSGRQPITVGPEGLIQPVLRVDARVRGNLEEERIVPAAAAVELWRAVRLDPGEKIEQTLRLDGPQLSALLASMPDATLTIAAEVTTNPAVIQTPEGTRHVTAPAGQSRPAQRIITRSGFPIESSDPALITLIDARLEVLRTGEPLERLRSAQWTVGMLQLLARDQEGEDPPAGPPSELSSRITDGLVRAAASVSLSGSDAHANAFVKYAAASVSPDSRERLMGELIRAQAFEIRMLGLLVASELADGAIVQSLVKPLAETDEDATVRAFAGYLAERQLEQPATAPTKPAADASVLTDRPEVAEAPAAAQDE